VRRIGFSDGDLFDASAPRRPAGSRALAQRGGAMSVRVNWRNDAACRHADPDLFFPIANTGPALRKVYEAKRICQACPVRAPCLAWALNHGVPYGIWGGTTEDERHALRGKLPAVSAVGDHGARP
jgi:WhiB family transcriptional regulator, redox-sensing transcriptional regulator